MPYGRAPLQQVCAPPASPSRWVRFPGRPSSWALPLCLALAFCSRPPVGPFLLGAQQVLLLLSAFLLTCLFLAALGLRGRTGSSLVAKGGGGSPVAALPLLQAQSLGYTGLAAPRHAGSQQGLNPWLPHGQLHSSPASQQGGPKLAFPLSRSEAERIRPSPLPTPARQEGCWCSVTAPLRLTLGGDTWRRF